MRDSLGPGSGSHGRAAAAGAADAAVGMVRGVRSLRHSQSVAVASDMVRVSSGVWMLLVGGGG